MKTYEDYDAYTPHKNTKTQKHKQCKRFFVLVDEVDRACCLLVILEDAV